MADFVKNVFVETVPACLRGPLHIHDSISITCHAYHYGDLKWYKIDKSSRVPKEITDSRVTTKQRTTRHGHYEKNSTLVIQSVTKGDEGTYVCWKSNGFNATRNVTIFIDVSGNLCLSILWSKESCHSYLLKSSPLLWHFCSNLTSF